VTLNAFHSGMRRILIGGELRFHRMAARPAKLGRLHVLDRPICELRPDKKIREGCDAKKPCQSLHCYLAIKSTLNQMLPNLALTQINADRDEHQSGKENGRNNQKDNNSDVGILGVAADLLR